MIFLDMNESVRSFTNKHGIWLSYQIDGSDYRYYPDLLVELMDGTIRLEEIKGYIADVQRVNAKEKVCIDFCLKRGWDYKMLFENDLEII